MAVIEANVAVTTETGERLEEVVTLEPVDFLVDDVQAAAFWEGVDPDTFGLFVDGTLSVTDFARSAVKMRAFLYALIRAKVSDSRIRQLVDLSDFQMSWSDLQAAAEALAEPGEESDNVQPD